MEEASVDEKWLNEPVTGELVSTGPSDAELITITLLGRLYDLNMALLNALDPKAADLIFETHENGENFNPPMFIPDIKVRDD